MGLGLAGLEGHVEKPSLHSAETPMNLDHRESFGQQPCPEPDELPQGERG